MAAKKSSTNTNEIDFRFQQYTNGNSKQRLNLKLYILEQLLNLQKCRTIIIKYSVFDGRTGYKNMLIVIYL